MRVVCNHAGEKKTLLDRILSLKQYVIKEPNMFASQKSHGWVWHYQTLVPKSVQTKGREAHVEEGERHDVDKTDSKEKLKETIEVIKSSNKTMSVIALNIFIKQELEKRQHEFMKYKELSILTFSWNVNGQKPPTDSVGYMDDIFSVRNIGLDVQNIKVTTADDIPDLLFFNFQEIVPLNAKSMISTGQQPQQWEKYLTQELNQYYRRAIREQSDAPIVEKLASHVQMGLFQVVFYKKSIGKLISEHQLAQVGTGILGVGGNKGAIGCSLKIGETKLAVINAHLAASQSKVQRRNQNVNQIIKSILFPYKNDEAYNLLEHDILLWCGDLNYRIASDSFEDVVDKIKNNKIAELRALDQLRQEKEAGNVFIDFEEAKLKFTPTYKFKVGTSDYDLKPSKVRIPSWCDRILYRGSVQQQFYTSVMTPTLSDHKPVASLFKAKYKVIDPVMQKNVSNSILDYLQSLKENFVPRLTLTTEQVDFKDVSYGDSKTQEVEICNAGDGLLEFDLAKGPASWLSVEPIRGVVKAGEKLKISFRLQIQIKEAQMMFMNKQVAESVTINTNEPEAARRTIPVTVSYLRSCFGAPLGLLNQCVGLPVAPGQRAKSVRDELQPLNT